MQMVRELGLRVTEIGEAALRGSLSNAVDGLHPLRQLPLIHRLEYVVPAILGIQLEDERAVVVDEVRNAGFHQAHDERRLPGGGEIQLFSRTLHAGRVDGLVAESARDGAHEMQERRHALFTPLVLLLRRRRLLAHGFIEEILSLLVLRLLLDPLLVKAATDRAVASVLFDLHGDRLLERPHRPPGGGWGTTRA